MSAALDQAAVLFIGATGYIGGSVLADFVQRYPEFIYTALIRNPKDTKAIASLNVRVVQGSHSDTELIERVASEHDIVVNGADADDVPLADAIIKGLFTRANSKDGSRKPIYIHTSGTGVVTDAVTGEFKDIKIYDDLKEEDIRSIGPKQPHRNVDLQIFAAGEQGSIDTYIIAPSTIYGTGRGPVRNISFQVNNVIRIAVERKQVLQIGPGTNVWNSVHIDDLVDLYALVLDKALNSAGDTTSSSPYARFFWGSSEKYVWGDILKGLAVRLHKKGLVQTDEVKAGVTVEEEPRLFKIAVGNNSRTVANRGLKTLGWKPSRPSLKDTLDEEIDLTLSQL